MGDPRNGRSAQRAIRAMGDPRNGRSAQWGLTAYAAFDGR